MQHVADTRPSAALSLRVRILDERTATATCIGYYRRNEGFDREEAGRARQPGDFAPNPTFLQKVIDIRDKLPASLKLIGSYVPIGGGSETRPAVWIVETDDPAELAFVNNWCAGFLDFQWSPATSVGATMQEVTDALDEAQARRWRSRRRHPCPARAASLEATAKRRSPRNLDGNSERSLIDRRQPGAPI